MSELTKRPPGELPGGDAVLDALKEGSDWLRSVSCTLARRGLAFRRVYPEQAKSYLDAMARSPLYKGGQFLFDLLEWEDFILDGPPPPILPTTFDAAALTRLASLLRTVQAHVEGDALPTAESLALTIVTPKDTDRDLPPLEAGNYLYPDVVLGFLQSATPLLEAQRAQRKSGT